MLTTLSAWQPPANMINHAGKPVDPNLIFFAPPTREIGEITTAHSTLKKNHRVLEWNTIILIVAAAAALGYGVDFFGEKWLGVSMAAQRWIWPAALACVPLAICLFMKYRTFSCSYVGKNGAMAAYCRDTDDTVRKQEVFLFNTAVDLKRSLTEMYHNGIYTSTQYMYIWTDASGKTVYRRIGSFNRSTIEKEVSNWYHFANSLDISWTWYLAQPALQKLNAGGYVHFAMPREAFFTINGTTAKRTPDEDYARVYNGYMEFQIQKKLYRYDFADIEQIKVEKGTLYILAYGAKKGILGNYTEGAVTVPCQVLLNMNLFIYLVETGLKLFNPNKNT